MKNIKHISYVIVILTIGFFGNNLLGQKSSVIKLIISENGNLKENLNNYKISSYLWTANDTVLIGNGLEINPPKNYKVGTIVGIFMVINEDTLNFYNNQLWETIGLPEEVYKDLLYDFQNILYKQSKWVLDIDFFPYSNYGNKLLVEDLELKKGDLYKNIVIFRLNETVSIPVLNSKLITEIYTSFQIDSISRYELNWLDSLKENRSIVGTIENDFIGGYSEYKKVFLNDLNPSNNLKNEKINNSVTFEIEINTQGEIINVKILSSNSRSVEKKVKEKIHLTSGKWKTKFKNGKEANYFIIDTVY